ncbi:antibiotic biosynthesis monooxygenase [Deinococcus maricopensis]|uniref:antibiotic biosynthesis monooxygenase n=1 Tax=Deinococcus maricopensis TaxID=309887 RepID=UPI001FE1D720|nr:antibiotic biosynthesis monooxygenase [Deinococcus maricopensis]
MTAVFVHYAEGKGDAARVALRALMATLPTQPGFVHAELLSAPDQPHLTLLSSHWTAQVPALPLPDGVRAWVFEVQATARNPARH